MAMIDWIPPPLANCPSSDMISQTKMKQLCRILYMDGRDRHHPF